MVQRYGSAHLNVPVDRMEQWRQPGLPGSSSRVPSGASLSRRCWDGSSSHSTALFRWRCPRPANSVEVGNCRWSLGASAGSRQPSWWHHVPHLADMLARGVPLLVLMRGPSGAGKSTLAARLTASGGVICSADDFFCDARGHYSFRPELLGEAHDACRQAVWRALRQRRTPVVVDNTNTEPWEMRPYVQMAVEFDVFLEIATPRTPWCCDAKALARRSNHGVPVDKIRDMLDRLQRNPVTPQVLYSLIGAAPKLWSSTSSAASKSHQLRCSGRVSHPARVGANFAALPKHVGSTKDVEPPAASCQSAFNAEEVDENVDPLSTAIEKSYGDNFETDILQQSSPCAVLIDNNLGSISHEHPSGCQPEVELYQVDQLIDDSSSVCDTDTTNLEDMMEELNLMPDVSGCSTVDSPPSRTVSTLAQELIPSGDFELDSSDDKCLTLSSDHSVSYLRAGLQSRISLKDQYDESHEHRRVNPSDVNRQFSSQPGLATLADVIRLSNKPPEEVLTLFESTPADEVENDADVGRSSSVQYTDTNFPRRLGRDVSTAPCAGSLSPGDRLLAARARVLSPPPSPTVPATPGGNCALDRSTMTSPSQLLRRGHAGRLQALFPDCRGELLADVLLQCQGDLNWAASLLLDEGWHMSAEAGETASDCSDRGLEQEGPLVVADSDTAGGRGVHSVEGAMMTVGGQFEFRDAEYDADTTVISGSYAGCVGVDSDWHYPAADDSSTTVMLSTAESPAPAANLVLDGRLADNTEGATDSGGGDGGATISNAAPHVSGSCSEDERVGDLTLEIPPQLAFQLQQLFGPVAPGFDNVGCLAALPAEGLRVQLSVDVARALFDSWRAGFRAAGGVDSAAVGAAVPSVERCLQNDEALARRLQLQEDSEAVADLSDAAVNIRSAVTTSPVPSLRQIMDEEIQYQRNSQVCRRTLADQLSLEQLRFQFPGVDAGFLDDLYDMHSGSYGQVLRVLQGTHGGHPTTTTAPAARFPVPQPASAGSFDGELEPDEKYQCLDKPGFDDLQAESALCRRRIDNAQQMMRQASSRRMPGVVLYYTQERDRYRARLDECRLRAALVAVELRQASSPDELDLHMLQVPEALQVLADFLAERQHSLIQQGIKKRRVHVITGQGHHSHSGQPRVKPAVVDWLGKKQYRCEEAPGNPGMLVVTVRDRF